MTGASSDAIRWLENAAPDINEAVEEALSSEEKCATNFNLFRVLGIERNEVTTHSRLLREILDPAGSHGQRGKPLSLFLRYCRGKGGEFATLPDLGDERDWRVTEEDLRPPYGRMDIVLESTANSTLIVIENKVDSAEGEDQCARYLEWMGTQKAFDRRVLIYLTPKGEAPNSLTSGVETLSYEIDIKAWLDDLIPKIKPLALQSTLEQYRDVVTSFGDFWSGEITMPELVAFVRKKENLEHALRVHDAVDEACRELDKEFWEVLRGEFRKWSPEPTVIERWQKRAEQNRWLEIWPEGIRKQSVGTYLFPCVQMCSDQIFWGIAWSGDPPAHLSGEVRSFQGHLEEALGLEVKREKKWWLGHVAKSARLRELYQQIASGEDVWTPIVDNVRALLNPDVIRYVDASNKELAKPEA